MITSPWCAPGWESQLCTTVRHSTLSVHWPSERCFIQSFVAHFTHVLNTALPHTAHNRPSTLHAVNSPWPCLFLSQIILSKKKRKKPECAQHRCFLSFRLIRPLPLDWVVLYKPGLIDSSADSFVVLVTQRRLSLFCHLFLTSSPFFLPFFLPSSLPLLMGPVDDAEHFHVIH